MRSRLPLLLASLLASACVVEAQPLPPPPRVLSPSEAVAVATHFARSHGLVVDHTQNAWLDRRTRWHVVLGGAGNRDRAAVTLDGYSGRVLAARLRGPSGEYVPPPPPGAPAEPAPPMPSEAPGAPPAVPPPPPPG
ncbi:MAG TPA: hypothetical protein VMG32_05440 [Anaeromyxobacteraceae bacterium]|nr:hypothetical protein [Anaeromyxobacteraceae bacterium]